MVAYWIRLSLFKQDPKTYAQANEAVLRHFRSSDGAHEVDFIIEKAGRVVAFEVKLSAAPEKRDFTHLKWLEKQFSNFAVTKCMITTGQYAYTNKEGIHIIPASLLGA